MEHVCSTALDSGRRHNGSHTPRWLFLVRVNEEITGKVYTSLAKIADLIGGLKMMFALALLHHLKGTNDRNTQSGNSNSPSIIPRELDGSSFGLGRGPVCRTTEVADGLSISSGHPFISSEKGGLENTDRCTHSMPRPKKVRVFSRGPVCSKNSGDCVKTSAGLPISSGLPDSRREESGNATMERGCHQKSRPKKSGCIMPTVKLGVVHDNDLAEV
ncbi:hypothetical protein Ancab_008695 [Ancistrocladus abbreviatus]